MSSVTPSESSRIQGPDLTLLHYKPFSSHEHYQQIMSAHRKLQESGFYFGAIGGREANMLLRNEPPGTFLVRDSSDRHHFFTLSVRTTLGTRNLRVHSEGGDFFLESDSQKREELPRFNCVVKLIANYMGKYPGHSEHDRNRPVYMLQSCGETIEMELRRPLKASMASLQHMCRRRLNEVGHGEAADVPQSLRGFMEEYDAPI